MKKYSGSDYSQILREISTQDFANEEIRILCKTYSNILESGNFKDENLVIKDFLTDVRSTKIDENVKNNIISNFKIYTISNLGLKESYDALIDNYEFKDLPIYKERLAVVKNLVEKEEDHLHINQVLDIYKSLSSENIILEQIGILEGNRDKFGDDIRVSNIINYLENSPDYKKYKISYDNCIESLQSYLMNPNGETRMSALDCLRKLSYDNVVKDFMNYLVSLNFSDDSYGLHHDYGEKTMATSRTYSGGYLERWFHGEEKAGLGKIVQEMQKDLDYLEKNINERHALSLVLERLSQKEKELNIDERRFFEKLKRLNTGFDLGIGLAINELRKNSVVSNIPSFRNVERFVNEKIEKGIPDRKYIHEAFNLLSKLDFDSGVVKCLDVIKEKFELNKESILVDNVIDYINENNRMGILDSFKNDLIQYQETKDSSLKKQIFERHSRTIIDSNLKSFLNSFVDLSGNKNNIVNPNPKEFIVEKVYSIVDTVDGKDHFKINDNFIIKNGSELILVKEEKISPSVSKYSKIIESMVTRISENKIEGMLDAKDEFEIVIDSITNESKLYINDTEVTFDNRANTIYIKENAGGSQIRMLLDLYDNINYLTEMDFVSTVKYQKDSKIKATIFNINDNYTINLINENQKFNKFCRTGKVSTLKETLLEYMGFDITATFSNELNIEKSKIDKLNEKAQRLFDDIQVSETSFESLENTISSFTDPLLITEGYKILESFKLEIDDNKKEYRNLIGLIQKYV